ncbi:hypothetical protein [Brevibacterium jeotgali]|uniref:Uncharacterized protein n=1 Tax=Brevibacterium jeotgali TaxID=1262550 RepID=A0A2H1L5J6_9MICO|nr:hypothetical protein [Brevibacterium jeotgali]TWC01392.1 hypothetical protein FB108_0036 [Brevibacterium jeotgali]SMY12171.1 hypothetical protein BJEO58_01765 [Brevibacterium jeotgali]
MSFSHPYPIPHRVALSIGLALIRWARSTTRSAGRLPHPEPTAHHHEDDHATAIRRHQVERQIESERADALRRYLTMPRQP